MSKSRVSNEQILTAINSLVEAMTAQIAQPTAVTVTEPKAAPAKAESIKIDKAYLNKMIPKWDQLANKVGEQFIGYAYRKSNGKLGLWGCKASDLAKVSNQERYVGNVHISDPS